MYFWLFTLINIIYFYIFTRTFIRNKETDLLEIHTSIGLIQTKNAIVGFKNYSLCHTLIWQKEI